MANITIGAVGDIKFDTRLKSNPLYDILKRSTVATANLECPLTSYDIPADKLFAIKAPPSVAKQLPGLGLQVVSVANNHAMDYAERGLMDTIKYVTREGITVVGGGKNLTEALVPSTIEAGALKIGFIGAACTLPAGSAATEKRPGIAPIRVYATFEIDSGEALEQPGSSPFIHTQVVQDDLEAVLRTIESSKKSVDLMIVSLHWGVTPGWQPVFQGSLAEYQAPLGRALIDAGANIVLGHHPHVLYGIEVYRQGIIFYSLGHFIFQGKGIFKEEKTKSGQLADPDRPKHADHLSPYTKGAGQAVVAGVKRLLSSPQAKESMIALIHIEALKRRKPKISAVEIIPCMMDQDGEPVETTPGQARNILARLKTYSEEFGTEIRFAEKRGYIDTA